MPSKRCCRHGVGREGTTTTTAAKGRSKENIARVKKAPAFAFFSLLPYAASKEHVKAGCRSINKASKVDPGRKGNATKEKARALKTCRRRGSDVSLRDTPALALSIFLEARLECSRTRDDRSTPTRGNGLSQKEGEAAHSGTRASATCGN